VGTPTQSLAASRAAADLIMKVLVRQLTHALVHANEDSIGEPDLPGDE